METVVIVVVRGQVGSAISWTGWPCVEAALPKGADAIHQVNEVFHSA